MQISIKTPLTVQDEEDRSCIYQGKVGEYAFSMVCLFLCNKIVSVKCPHNRGPFADKLPLAES